MLDTELPRPNVAVDVVVPYDRGDLVARVYREAEVDSVEHLEDGTRIVGRTGPSLAAELTAASAGPATS